MPLLSKAYPIPKNTPPNPHFYAVIEISLGKPLSNRPYWQRNQIPGGIFMKTISIGSMSLFLTLPLFAMESTSSEKYINNTESWQMELAWLSSKNLIPNTFQISEKEKKNNFTQYSAFHELFPESNFAKDNEYIHLNDTDYVSLEADALVPGLFHVAIKSPSKKTELLRSNHESHIISFALSADKTEIVVGREDGSMTFFDISAYPETQTYSFSDRNCSLEPIGSVAFIDKKRIIATDITGKVHYFNTETNVLLNITGKHTALKCPSYNPEQVLIVKDLTFEPSPDLPVNFLNHRFTPGQCNLLFQIAEIKKDTLNQKVLDTNTFQEMEKTLLDCKFELPIQEALTTKLQWAKKASKPQKPDVLAAIKENAMDYLKILHRCYTDFTQPVIPETKNQ